MKDGNYPDEDGFLFYGSDLSVNADFFGKAIDLIPNPVFMNQPLPSAMNSQEQ
jgi:hypothetical protein